MTNKAKKQKITLSFNPSQGQYVETFPLHHSQKLIKLARDEMVFEVHLVPTHDFIQELLSYGSDLEVVAPTLLRNTIHNVLAETLTYYAM
jgi:proteasome accessory factor B